MLYAKSISLYALLIRTSKINSLTTSKNLEKGTFKSSRMLSFLTLHSFLQLYHLKKFLLTFPMILALQKGQQSNVLRTPFCLKNSSALSSEDAVCSSSTKFMS